MKTTELTIDSKTALVEAIQGWLNNEDVQIELDGHGITQHCSAETLANNLEGFISGIVMINSLGK